MNNAINFITAGNAVFTVDNGKGGHYTYRVRKPDNFRGEFFLSVLTGPDNTRNYTYAGMLHVDTGEVRATAGSKIREDAKSFRVARWALRLVWGEIEFPEGYSLHHEGRCGRCGRVLTVPESILNGIGPECAKHMEVV